MLCYSIIVIEIFEIEAEDEKEEMRDKGDEKEEKTISSPSLLPLFSSSFSVSLLSLPLFLRPVCDIASYEVINYQNLSTKKADIIIETKIHRFFLNLEKGKWSKKRGDITLCYENTKR